MERVDALDPRYPTRLRDLPDPPSALECAGAWLPDSPPAVALVGTRRPSPEGLLFARELAAELASAGVIVLSGGALGIDKAAHEGALEGGGRTWAVLVSASHPAPRRHRGLFHAIQDQGGGLLSEVDQPSHGRAFLLRNRLVAALAHAVVVIQARERSGTAATARWARRLGRPLGAVPWGPYEPAGVGCQEILQDGGFWVRTAQEVMERLPSFLSLSVPVEPEVDPWLQVIQHRGHLTAEELSHALGRPLAEALRELGRLELLGKVAIEGGIARPRSTRPAWQSGPPR